jgi:soluble lytic murein transglycosylase-like protein
VRKYYWDWRVGLSNLIILVFCILLWVAVYCFFTASWEAWKLGKEQDRVEIHKIVIKTDKPKTELTLNLERVFAKYRQAHPEQYAKWVERYAKQYQIPPKILAGIVLQESSGNPKAHNKSDPGDGSRGLTQVCWKWWGKSLKKEGIAKTPNDLFHPQRSIQAGAFVLRCLIDQHDGNLRLALKHYSGGSPDYYSRIQARVRL